MIECTETQFGTSVIRQRNSDGYLNATDMCKANNKKYNDWYRLNNTDEFLKELSCDTGYPVSQLVEIYKGNSKKFQQGTWIHPYVATNLAQWLSPKFAVFVSKLVFRYITGDTSLIEEIKQNHDALQTELLKKDEQIAKLESKQLKLESFVKNIKTLEKDQMFYISTTRNYASQNRFEYGGVKELKDLNTRLATYNTGRAEGDLIYYTKLFKCNNYKLIEERVGSVLCQFKDKVGSRKEMIHMRYNLLLEVVEFICDNYDREVEYINSRCQQFLHDTIECDSIIPEPLDLSDYVEVSVRRNGVTKTKKIDVSNWDESKIDALIEDIINRCATEQRNVNYDFTTQKNSVALELTWGLITPYLNVYNGLTKTDWRAKFKELLSREKPKKLKIKGIKLV